MRPDKPVAHRADYRCEVVAPSAVREIISEHHYARSSSHRAWTWALLRDDMIVGAAAFLPPLPPAALKLSHLAREHARVVDPRKVIALSRLVIAPSEPQNAASILVGAALRGVRRERRWHAVITYADQAQGHTGQIYRALNATPLGVTDPEPYWIDPATGARVSRKATRSRTVAEMRALGLEQRVSPGKFRFAWWFVNPLRECP